MTNELKPKKITHKKGYVYETEEENGFESGFNEACDQWEAYIKTPEFLQSLIDEEWFEVDWESASLVLNYTPFLIKDKKVSIHWGLPKDASNILAKAISQNASKIIKVKEPNE